MRFFKSPVVVALALAVSTFASPASSVTDEELTVLTRIAKLSKTDFIVGAHDINLELKEVAVSLLQEGEEEERDNLDFLEVIVVCAGAATAIAGQVLNVNDVCGMAIEDLIDIANIQDLINLCGNDNVEDCVQALQDAIAVAEPEFDMCVDAVDGLLGNIGIQIDIPPAVDNALDTIAGAVEGGILSQAVCLANNLTEDALDCAASLTAFIQGSGIDAVLCLGEFVNQEEACSEECAAVADTFIDAAGCCATGLVYSLNINQILMNFNTSFEMTTEELTLCGSPLFGCDELQQMFDDNGLSNIALPAPRVLETEAPETNAPEETEGGEEQVPIGAGTGNGENSASAIATATSSLLVFVGAAAAAALL